MLVMSFSPLGNSWMFLAVGLVTADFIEGGVIMKRFLLLFPLLCLLALMSVSADEGSVYTAASEPVLIQVSLDQSFGIGECNEVLANLSKTDSSLFFVYNIQHDAVMSEMGSFITLTKTSERLRC